MALVGLGELRDVNITACPFVSIEFVSFSENSAREPGLGERVLRLHEARQLDQSRLLRGVLHSVRPRCFQLIAVRFIFNRSFYFRRTDLGIERDLDPHRQKNLKNFR